MIVVEKYDTSKKEEWNNFLNSSKNSSFLLNRDFMDYHADRFEDYSIMVYEKKQLIAVVPGNKVDSIVTSHQGLTYGGVVVGFENTFRKTTEIYCELLRYYKENGICKFKLKLIPRLYLEKSCDEHDWILFRLGADLYRRDISYTVDLNGETKFQERKKRLIKKAAKHGAVVVKNNATGVVSFWDKILEPNLKKKWGISPVHSCAEILNLMNKFPDQIKFHGVYVESELVAGTLVFINRGAVHAQYIANSDVGKSIGALDFLFNRLITEEYVNFKYFDFGISNENMGKDINWGLLEWKEGFGASPVVHDFYEINTENFNVLEKILRSV